MKSLLRVVPIWAALSLTMLLLVLVGVGEARRNYYLFRLDTATVQSESMLRVLRHDLENGTPLTSISGLAALTKNLADSDDALLDVAFYGEDGRLVTSVNNEIQTTAKSESFDVCKVRPRDESYTVTESKDLLCVVKDVQTRFGVVGSVELILDKRTFTQELSDSFRTMGIAALIMIAILYVVMVFLTRRFWQDSLRMKRWIQVSYFIIFLVCSGVIIDQTLKVYTKAVECKSQALGKFLARRLSMASSAGIEFKDLSGVNGLLAAFKKEHSEICAIDLLVNGEPVYSALPDTNVPNGARIFKDEDVFAYKMALDVRSTNGGDASGILNLLVKVPKSVIRDAVYNGALNLLVLLFACSLMANLILEIGVTQLSAKLISDGAKAAPTVQEALASMQTAYMIMGFINALTLPFLAPLLKDITGDVTSLPFTAFFLAFALFMIPAGKLAERGYTRHLLMFGALFEVIGCVLVATCSSLWLLTVGRSFSGLGQGIFLIGFQSFIISVTTKGERTQGQALKVIIRYTVLMAGSAIGALMYVFLDYAIVFAISGVLGAVAFLHILFSLPDPNAVKVPTSDTKVLRKNESGDAKKFSLGHFFLIFKDAEFLKTLLLTGIPSKIAVAGIVMFSIPLLMAEQGVPAESIGRYLMLYYVSCMFVSRFTAKLADKSGKTKRLLSGGAFLGGIGFVLLGGLTGGMIDIPGIEDWMIILMAVSIVFGGAANGMMAAPILTHIGKTESAKTQGAKTMVAVYSFAERFGHISGSALMVYCAAFTGSMGLAIFSFGAVYILLGMLFHILAKKA